MTKATKATKKGKRPVSRRDALLTRMDDLLADLSDFVDDLEGIIESQAEVDSGLKIAGYSPVDDNLLGVLKEDLEMLQPVVEALDGVIH